MLTSTTRYWAILWVDCESEASARTDFEKIGKKCGWSSDSVKDQLAGPESQSLLILDNCDDVKTDYNRYIPTGSQVSVVLTTRLSDARKYASAGPHGMGRKKLFLRLEGLDAESAVDLVLEASDVEERNPEIIDQATQIVAALDFHPLALNAASSLIRSAVYSLGEYADALETRLAQRELLDTESEQARYLRVSTTFEVSAESLQSLASTDPTAKAALALLDILGFMHHQNVSEEIFVRAWEYGDEILSHPESTVGGYGIGCLSAWDLHRCRSIFPSLPPDERIRLFRKARAHLYRLSLVNIGQAGKSMSLHLVVHAWARERVSRYHETWTDVALMLALSAQGHVDWQPFTPQLVCQYDVVFAFMQKVPIGSTMSDRWLRCRILCTYAWQMFQARLGSTRLLDTCLQLESQMQGMPCDRTSVIMAGYLLGMAYLNNTQIPEAIDVLERVANMQSELSEDDGLVIQQALARAYLADGQNIKAIEILEYVVKVREEKLREDHPDRLASEHHLASACIAEGRTARAIELLEHVVKMKEEDCPTRLAFQRTSRTRTTQTVKPLERSRYYST
jgi:tetratricopeptide (TPR) repeat protein